jgi:hypothetical protein
MVGPPLAILFGTSRDRNSWLSSDSISSSIYDLDTVTFANLVISPLLIDISHYRQWIKVIVISNMRAPILIYTSCFWNWVGRKLQTTDSFLQRFLVVER